MSWLTDLVRANSVSVPIPGLHNPTGVGDVVSRITSSVGIEPCTPCELRRQWLNEHFRFVPYDNGHSNVNEEPDGRGPDVFGGGLG